MAEKRVRNHVKKHPAEYGAAGVYAAVVAILRNFHVSDQDAYVIAGAVVALTPAVMTWLRNRGWI
jgi:hypothetical protein